VAHCCISPTRADTPTFLEAHSVPLPPDVELGGLPGRSWVSGWHTFHLGWVVPTCTTPNLGRHFSTPASLGFGTFLTLCWVSHYYSTCRTASGLGLRLGTLLRTLPACKYHCSTTPAGTAGTDCRQHFLPHPHSFRVWNIRFSLPPRIWFNLQTRFGGGFWFSTGTRNSLLSSTARLCAEDLPPLWFLTDGGLLQHDEDSSTLRTRLLRCLVWGLSLQV